jgi:hypothetical protein
LERSSALGETVNAQNAAAAPAAIANPLLTFELRDFILSLRLVELFDWWTNAGNADWFLRS